MCGRGSRWNWENEQPEQTQGVAIGWVVWNWGWEIVRGLFLWLLIEVEETAGVEVYGGRDGGGQGEWGVKLRER